MNDPERLINEGATDFERLLMDGASNERPSPELGARMVAGLERVLDARAAAPATAWSVPWMWLGALALAGGLAAVALLTLRRDAPAPSATEIAATAVPPTPPALAVPEQAAKADEAPRPEVARPLEGALPDPGAELAAPRGSTLRPDAKARSERAAKAAVPDAPAAGGDLREEMRLIQRARAGVREHDGARALAELRDYAARFPNGTFAPEATVLRVEALDLDGQHAQAVALGRRFLGAHPDSPLADRVEHITGRDSKSP